MAGVPVDYDPFAEEQTPAQGTPIDRDPFAPPVGQLEDIARAGVAGVAQGAAGIPGIAGDVQQLSRAGARWAGVPDFIGDAARGIVEYATGKRLTPEQRAQAEQQIGSYAADLPTTQDIVGAASRNIPGAVGVVDYEPQTTAGEYARTVGQMAPAALAPGSLAARAARVVVPGLASEGAGQLAESYDAGPVAEAGARLLGALGGVGAVEATRGLSRAVVDSLQRNPERVLERALQSVTPDDINAASMLMDDAARRGVPITWSEAINGATGGRASNLARIQRVLENSPETSGLFDQMIAGRRDAIRSAAGREFDAVAERTLSPVETAMGAQDAAENAIQSARGARTRAVAPFYRATAGQTVPEDRVAGMVQNIDRLIAEDPTGQATGAARQIRDQLLESPGRPAVPAGARQPITDARGNVIRYEPGTPAQEAIPPRYRTDVGELDQIYGRARDDFVRPLGPDATGTQAREARLARGAVNELNQGLTDVSPQLNEARQMYGQLSREYVDPVVGGPVGDIASQRRPSVETATGALFPRNPPAGQAAVTKDAYRRLRLQNPEVADNLVRQHLENTFNQSVREFATSDGAFSGAKFSSAIKGNPEQMEVLKQTLEAMPAGETRWKGFSRFLDVLDATGERLPANSATSFNQAIRDQAAQGSRALETTVGIARGPLRAVNNLWTEWQTGRNLESLAQLLTDRKAMGTLGRLARAQPGSDAAHNLAVRLTARAVQLNNARQSGAQSE